MTIKGLLVGFIAGLVVATFTPKLASIARTGFDSARNVAGLAVETAGEAARP
jgi:hypothetical protein